MGSESIDLSLGNIWKSWFAFRKGKKYSRELHEFQYHLEENIAELFEDLNSGKYQHGSYKKFIVADNKKREVSVAHIRDRIVHRVIYDLLTKLYDKTFIYDAWSCRTGKGLLGCIKRTQQFLKSYPQSHIWKGDVRKFFDSVNQNVLLQILARKIKDEKTMNLLKKIVFSFERERERERERVAACVECQSEISRAKSSQTSISTNSIVS
ncbi:MAG: hypothetical protein AAB551_01750 [Patescibacteria group bacterium]